MSNMRQEVVAIFLADIHLSDRAPLARAEKKNWQDIQFGYLDQIHGLWDWYNHPPVIIAGDIFDKWKVSPETINRAIAYFSRFMKVAGCAGMWAVPGQHDLPYHNYKDIEKSSYGTLMNSRVIDNIKPNGPPFALAGSLILHGFPWGTEPEPFDSRKEWDKNWKGCKHVAVIHKYIWKEGYDYPGRPQEGHVAYLSECRKCYDLIVAGDNHRSFNRQNVWNCGNFINRKSDEKTNEPRVLLYLKDGTVKEQLLDTSKDRWIEESVLKELKENNKDLEGFLETLGSMEDVVLDFAEAVKRYFDKHKVGKGVRKLILEALEG